MLFKSLVVLLLASTSLASAHNPRHGHQHRRSVEKLEERDTEPDSCHKKQHHHSGTTVAPEETAAAETTTVTSTTFLTVTVLPEKGVASSSTTAAEFYEYGTSVSPTTLVTSTTPVSSAMPVATTTPVSSAVPVSATSGKRGLAYNSPALTDIFAGKGMSWAYNWGQSAGGTIAAGLDYVPMLWGMKMVSGWNTAAAAAIAAGSGHMLSFNEPDLGSQANMSPADAAAAHIQYMNPYSGQAKISSPAITNSGASGQGISWLSQFFDACDGKCKVDFVAFHWYNNPGSISDFKQHVSDVVAFAATQGIGEVWLTEFGLNSGSDSDITSFLGEALPYLDSVSAVQRYAYFMCGTDSGQLVSGGSASTVGNAYST